MFAGKVTVSGDSTIDPMQIIHDPFGSNIVEPAEHACYRYKSWSRFVTGPVRNGKKN